MGPNNEGTQFSVIGQWVLAMREQFGGAGQWVLAMREQFSVAGQWDASFLSVYFAGLCRSGDQEISDLTPKLYFKLRAPTHPHSSHHVHPLQ